MTSPRQIGSAPRYRPQGRVRPPRAVDLDYGDSLATIIIGGAAGIAAKALDEAADEERQRLEIAGQIEGVGAGHAAALAGQPVPEGDVTTWHGKAYARGARTGFATALENRLILETDALAADAGDDVRAFDKGLARIREGFSQLPPDLAAAADVSLSERGREHRLAIETRLAKRKAEVQELADRTALRLRGEEAQRFAADGAYQQAEFARRGFHAAVGALVASGGMSADEAQATSQRLDYEMEEQRALGGFVRAAKGGASAAYAYVGQLTEAADAFSTPDTRSRVLQTLAGRLTTMAAEESRRQAAAEKTRRQIEDATFKRAVDMQADGQLSLDWLRRNRAGLSATDYGQLHRMLNDVPPSRTDPDVYTDLQSRAIAGEDVRAEVKRAYTAGHLTRENFDRLDGVVQAGFDRVIKEASDRIAMFSGATGWFSDDLSRQRNAQGQSELLDWRDKQRAAGLPITPDGARVVADKAIRSWALVKFEDVAPEPQFAVRDKLGAFDVAASRAATLAALKAGRLSQSEAAEEARRIDALEERERKAREAAEEYIRRYGDPKNK